MSKTASACATCGAPLPSVGAACPFCGAAAENPRSIEEQKGALDSFHVALGIATQQKGRHFKVRNRLLQDAFVPSYPDLLIEEAMRCHQMFNESTMDSAGPRARFEACLARLELLADDDAHIANKVAHLQELLVAQKLREQSYRQVGCLLLIIVLLVIVAVMFFAVRSCGAG